MSNHPTTINGQSQPTLAQILQVLEQDMCELHMRWKLYRELFTHSGERIDLLNSVAPALWAALQRIIQDSVYLSIARLTDAAQSCGHSNFTIASLTIAATNEGLDQLASDIDAHITRIRSAAETIRWHRHKRLAHKDADVAQKNSYDRPSILAIENVLNELRTTFNHIRSSIDLPHCAYEHVQYAGGGNSVARCLAQGCRLAKLRRRVLSGTLSPEQLTQELVKRENNAQD